MKFNLNNRQQLLGIFAIAIVVLWAGDKLVISPLYGGWTARAKRITTLKTSVRDGNWTLAHEQDIRKEWDFMRKNTLTNEMSGAESQMLNAFDRWERDSGVSINGRRPQWKKGDDDYWTLDCRVDASGNLDALSKFLYAIEKDPLGVKVDTVDITSRNPGGEQLTLGLLVSGLQLKRP
jgi:hypothetical protein